MMGSERQLTFPRREVATRRVEWTVRPPQVEAGEEDYDRYETDRMNVMGLIKDECSPHLPHDLRVIEGDDETIISYEIQRVVLKDK